METIRGFVESLYDFRIRFRFIVGAFGQLGRVFVHQVMLVSRCLKSRHGFLKHIQAASCGHFLRQVTYGTIRRTCHSSTLGLLYAGNNAHQRSFTGTVASHQADTIAVAYQETHVAEQVIAGKMY